MGTITEREGKRGRTYKVQVRRKGYVTQTESFATKDAAKRWMRQVESQMDEGRFVTQKPAQNTSLFSALERYERTVTPTKKSAAKERSIIKIWKSHKLAQRPLAYLKSSDFAEARDELLQENKPATVRRYLALLSNVFTVARKDWGFAGLQNPLLDVTKPQVSDARDRTIRALDMHVHEVEEDDDDMPADRKELVSEIESLVAATGSKWLPLAIDFAIETAMRRSEITSLCWENVGIKKRVAHLPATKNGTARDVPLSPKAINILSSLDPTKGGRVFPVTPDALTKAFTRALERARERYLQTQLRRGERVDDHFLVGLRFHDLRHEAITRLAKIFALHELAKITGHKSSHMLLRYYHPKAQELAMKFPDVVASKI